MVTISVTEADSEVTAAAENVTKWYGWKCVCEEDNTCNEKVVSIIKIKWNKILYILCNIHIAWFNH